MVILRDNNTPRNVRVTCDGENVERWQAADDAQGVAFSLEMDAAGSWLKTWAGEIKIIEDADVEP